MTEVFYEAIPATDGATMNPVPGAVFQVFELADTTFTTPLSLRVGSGNPTTTVTASDTLATLPGVYVTSDNFEHIWKSGTFEWRRDSIDGAKKAIDAAAAAAAASRSAAENAAALVDAPADQIMATTAGNPASQFSAQQSANFVAKKERVRPLGAIKTLLSTGTHLGFPFALTAGDGNLVVAWREGANHAPSKGVMQVARYTQAGTALTAPVTVYTDSTYDCRDAGLLLLADGRLALTFFVYNHTAETAILDGCRVMFSTDHGITWGTPITIDSAFTTWAASAGPMIQLPTGELLMPTYGSSAGQNFQHAHVSRSTDGGATWAPLAVIADGDTQGSRHYQEPNIIVTDAGNILAVIRSDTALAHFTSRSTDGGASWSTPVNAFPGNGAPRLTKQAGYIQCVHRHETTGRAVKISSGDNGGTWGNQIVLPVVGNKFTSAYGVAVPYGKDSLRYIYSLQEGANNVATADLFQVDSIVPEDRIMPGPVTCRLRNTATVQINNAAWTTLTFNTEDHDTAGLHNTAANTSRIVPTVAGYYQVKGTVYFAASTAAQVQARIIKNGQTAGIPGLRDKKNPVSGQDSLVTASGVLYLGVGDFLELQAYQDSGAAVSARFEDTVFEVSLLSASA